MQQHSRKPLATQERQQNLLYWSVLGAGILFVGPALTFGLATTGLPIFIALALTATSLAAILLYLRTKLLTTRSHLETLSSLKKISKAQKQKKKTKLELLLLNTDHLQNHPHYDLIADLITKLTFIPLPYIPDPDIGQTLKKHNFLHLTEFMNSEHYPYDFERLPGVGSKTITFVKRSLDAFNFELQTSVDPVKRQNYCTAFPYRSDAKTTPEALSSLIAGAWFHTYGHALPDRYEWASEIVFNTAKPSSTQTKAIRRQFTLTESAYKTSREYPSSRKPITQDPEEFAIKYGAIFNNKTL